MFGSLYYWQIFAQQNSADFIDFLPVHQDDYYRGPLCDNNLCHDTCTSNSWALPSNQVIITKTLLSDTESHIWDYMQQNHDSQHHFLVFTAIPSKLLLQKHHFQVLTPLLQIHNLFTHFMILKLFPILKGYKAIKLLICILNMDLPQQSKHGIQWEEKEIKLHKGPQHIF